MRTLFQLLLMLMSTMLCSQNTNYVTLEDSKVHYKTYGEGKAVLIINGGPGFNSQGFEGIAKEIAALGYTAIVYDQRGTGFSVLDKIDRSTITLDLMVEDIEALRVQLGFNNWIIFGHSFGGMLANYYTSKHPECVSALIHSSSGGLDLALLENAQEHLYSRLTTIEIDSLNYWRYQMQAENTEFNRQQYNNYLASAYVYNKEYSPAISQRLMQGNMQINGLVWADMNEMHFDCKSSLSHFKKPVLIIQGKQDIIPESLALTAQNTFSNSRLVLLEKSGHYGWLDRKDTYLAEIKKFLYQIEKADVIKVIENYVQAVYRRDTTLVNTVSDSTLQKSGFYWSDKIKEWSYHHMNFTQLWNTVNTYNKTDWLPEWAPCDIKIYEVKEKIASAKVKAIWGFDYLLLSKNSRGAWLIDKVLWQSFTEKEAKSYFKTLKNGPSDN